VLLLLPVLVGCADRAPAPDPPGAWDRVPVSIQGRLAEDAPADGLTEAQILGESEVVHLRGEVEFWNDHIRYADVAEASEAAEGAEGLTLRIWFTEEGAERISAVTAANIGSRFALTVNGHVISAPSIARPVRADPGIPVVVEAQVPQEEAVRLAGAIRSTWPARDAP
jgi:preprotein translocase subunit SecD